MRFGLRGAQLQLLDVYFDNRLQDAFQTTYLGVPCLTLRNNTERPVTVSVGTNVIIGQERIGSAAMGWARRRKDRCYCLFALARAAGSMATLI
jgi:hypothetical protein